LIPEQQGDVTVPQADKILNEYLVIAARAGDQAAFRHLVRRWHRPMVAHAWRLIGDQEAALDAVQTAWTEIVKGLGRLQDELAFPAWAFRIVTRACNRQVRQKIRQRDLASALACELETEAPDPDVGPTVARLRSAIRTLPPDQRAAIALFHFEEMSVAEVAVALDVPVGTVKTRLMHGRRKLRAALEGED